MSLPLVAKSCAHCHLIMHMGGAHEALTLIEGLWEVNGCHRRAAIFLSDIATDELFH